MSRDGANKNRLLAGRYRIEEQIGEGGMGVVHRGRDERLERAVAIKVLSAGTMGDARAKERLRREAMAGAALEHVGIAHVYDVGDTDDGGAFLVMELVEGVSLRAFAGDSRWEPRARVGAIVETARALGAAHRAGLVHRDVKPDNIMRRSDGRIVLLDFGIAKSGDERVEATALTGAGVVVGTPAYLSPEQASGLAIDARTDQFALAVTAYELLSGTIPWPTSSAIALVTALLRDPAPALSMGDADLAAALWGPIERALAKSPAARFPDIDSFADALATAAGLPLSSSAPSLRAVSAETSVGIATPEALARTELQPSGAALSPTKHRAGRWLGAAVAIPAMATALIFGWRARQNPLSVPDPVLGCVVFEGRDRGTSAGWLGAAAASRFCEYAAPALGGTHKHVRFPADLLNLSHVPAPAFPLDPYQEPDARAKTVAEAKRRGLTYAEGSVEATDEGFAMTVTVRAATGREVGSATATAQTLGEAAAGALDALLASGVIPARPGLDPYVEEWFGPRTIRQAITDARLDMEQGAATKRLCASTQSPGTGKEGIVWRSVCSKPPAEEPPPLVSDLGAVVRYAMHSQRRLTEEQQAVLRGSFTEQFSKLRDPSLRAQAQLLMCQVAERDGEGAESLSVMAAEQEDPRFATIMAGLDPGEDTLRARRSAAWGPDMVQTWKALTWSSAQATQGPQWGERQYVLDATGESAFAYANQALRDGRVDIAVAVAGRLSRSDEVFDRSLSSPLRCLATAARGRLGAAREDLDAMLAPGPLDQTSMTFLRTRRYLSLLLGHEREDADRVLTRSLLGQVNTLEPTDGVWAIRYLATCAYASPEIARRCLDVVAPFVGSQATGSAELLEAVKRWVAGDATGAALAARPTARQFFVTSNAGDVLAMIFDAAKLYEFSEQVNPSSPTIRGMFNGEDWFTVLRARRAFARGDREMGKQLAKRIIDAWKLADVPVPAVAEMEAELAKP